MTAKAKICHRCSGAMHFVKLDKVSAGESPVRLTVTGMPAYACAKGHRVPAHREIMVWLLHELRDRHVPAIPGGAAQGLLFKKYHCACGAQLPAQSARDGAFEFDLAYPGSDAFRGAIEVALHQCAACGKAQARSAKEVAAAALAGVAALNDAAGFPHSG